MAKVKRIRLAGKLPASSILEVVVSMVIIISVIGTGLMILANVTRLSLSVKKVKANAMLQQELTDVNSTRKTDDEVLAKDGWRIEKKFKPYNADNSLLEADFTVYDPNNVLISQLKSVIIHETN